MAEDDPAASAVEAQEPAVAPTEDTSDEERAPQPRKAGDEEDEDGAPSPDEGEEPEEAAGNEPADASGSDAEDDEDEDDEDEDDEDEDDEDKKNAPPPLPRRSNFYLHDDRFGEESRAKPTKRQGKKLWSEKADRWQHDKFDDSEEPAPRPKREPRPDKSERGERAERGARTPRGRGGRGRGARDRVNGHEERPNVETEAVSATDEPPRRGGRGGPEGGSTASPAARPSGANPPRTTPVRGRGVRGGHSPAYPTGRGTPEGMSQPISTPPARGRGTRGRGRGDGRNGYVDGSRLSSSPAEFVPAAQRSGEDGSGGMSIGASEFSPQQYFSPQFPGQGGPYEGYMVPGMQGQMQGQQQFVQFVPVVMGNDGQQYFYGSPSAMQNLPPGMQPGLQPIPVPQGPPGAEGDFSHGQPIMAPQFASPPPADKPQSHRYSTMSFGPRSGGPGR